MSSLHDIPQTVQIARQARWKVVAGHGSWKYAAVMGGRFEEHEAERL